MCFNQPWPLQSEWAKLLDEEEEAADAPDAKL